MGVLFQIYTLLRYFLDSVINYLFSLYYNSNRVYIPKAKNKLILESASSLAKKIRLKQVKSEEVVRAFVERIQEVNDVLNAIVDNRFEEALEEAKQIDEDIQNDKITDEEFNKKPFLGVPFTTKESTACKGMKWSFGLQCRKDVRAENDAHVVELMKKAGGILIGVTNVPQLNLWTETYNTLYGTTNNPYNTTRNVGGSSGGEGSIIAACGSPIGIGSDIGGSLRIPSFRCGIFGHKCSPDLISTHGLTYRKGDEGSTMVVAGPMTRYSEDLVPLFKVLLGENVSKLQLDKKVDVKELNVFYMTSMNCIFSSPISDDITHMITKVIIHFSENLQMQTKQVNFSAAHQAIRLWSFMIKQEKSNFRRDIKNRTDEAYLSVELIKYICAVSEYNAYTIMNLTNTYMPKPPEKWAIETIDKLKTDILEILGDNGVLLFPSEAFPASYHYTSLFRPFNFSYYALWNVLKLPVTQVPVGLNSEGLPLGIQVVAAPYQDHLCIAVAKEIERAFGGYVPPFKMEN